MPFRPMLSPFADPSPASREGTEALTERYLALRGRVGGGEGHVSGLATTHTSPLPLETKRVISSMKSYRNNKLKEATDLYECEFLQPKKTKRIIMDGIIDSKEWNKQFEDSTPIHIKKGKLTKITKVVDLTHLCGCDTFEEYHTIGICDAVKRGK